MTVPTVERGLCDVAFCSIAIAATLPSPISDPTYDFVSTYIGPRNSDLDIVEFTAQFDLTRSVFIFRAKLSGAIRQTPNSVYVICVNRGNGSALLESIGMSSVLCDSAVIVKNNGVATVATFEPAFKNSPLNGTVKIKGAEFEITVPALQLPTTGFALGDYTVILWSRSDGGKNDLVADVAPDSGSLKVSIAPSAQSGGTQFHGAAGRQGQDATA